MESIIVNPSFLKPYDFEINHFHGIQNWVTNYWHLSIPACVAYVVMVNLGQKWMTNRKPFNLHTPLIWWNIGLSLGSLFMFTRVFPETSYEVKHSGVYNSVCKKDGRTMTLSFWALVFALSKILEFGDTAFIVLRKKPLGFLHWYHHISVTLVSFFGVAEFDPIIRSYASMNSLIHFFMYGYYALKAIKVPVPQAISKVITSSQILQMIVGLLLTIMSLVGKVSGKGCDRPYTNIFITLVVATSYLFLFLQFFINAYIVKSSRKNKD